MSRDESSTWRPLLVWLAATGALLGAVTLAPGAGSVGSSPAAVADVLVAGCATALTLALAWLWLVTTIVVVGLLRGRTPTGGGATRHLVLLACGAAVVAGTSVPAVASGGDPAGSGVLAGLPMPERAAAGTGRPPRVRTATPAKVPPTGADTDHYVVRPGDSLWSVARAHPSNGSGTDQRWREIWRANRDVLGEDPDLILPGQALLLPGTRTDLPTDHPAEDDTETDGAQ